MQPNSTLIISYLIGVIDMSVAKGNRNQKIAINHKFGANPADIILGAHASLPFLQPVLLFFFNAVKTFPLNKKIWDYSSIQKNIYKSTN